MLLILPNAYLSNPD